MEIVVFEQNGSGQKKISGIRKYGRNMTITRIVNITEALPVLVDNPEEYIADDFTADLVLDYLTHPDLSHYLTSLCVRKNIPVISSGKKNPDAFTPFTCCGLGANRKLGEYGEQFGLPEYEVTLDGNRIASLRVIRGAPCGASWEILSRVTGTDIEEALTLLPREVQYRCVANPSRFDPVSGKSPVHYAGHVHRAALQKAINNAQGRGEDEPGGD
jgi:thymidylate synthase